MTESEKKEYERIQAKIVNKLAIVLGCAAIIFVIWVYCINTSVKIYRAKS